MKKKKMRYLGYLVMFLLLKSVTSVSSIHAAERKGQKSGSNDGRTLMPRNHSALTFKDASQAARFHSTEQRTEKTVYLTFDDGPHRVSEGFLSILDQYDAKATFFVLDGNVKQFPEAVKQMAAAGHALGLHGVTHDKSKIYSSPKTMIQEMDQVRETIKEITGIDSLLIRTPYGSAPHMKEDYKQAVVDNGYIMWDWNIDSKDWLHRDKRMVDSIIEQLAAVPGKQEPIVILLHEREETLAQLPRLLEYLSEQKYEFKALDPSMVPIHLK